MAIRVELVDAAGRPQGEPRNIIEVATTFLDGAFGPAWRRATGTLLRLWPYPWDDNDLPGEPPLAYETQAIGFMQVCIAIDGRAYYRHPHTVAEVLGPGLRAWMAALGPDAVPAAYRILGPEIDPIARRSTPVPRYVTEVTPYAPGEEPAFRIRPIPPEPPAPLSAAAFGVARPGPDWSGRPGHTDLVEILVAPTLLADLLKARPFSPEMEEGGFLIGQIYADEDRPGTYLAEVSDAVPADQVGASFLHFTFTGDSFDRIKQRLATEHRGQRLLGWFHTHLFPAAETMGLSSVDLRLHFTTFRVPWQIAGLVNIDGEDRVLRFYVRDGDRMALCHHQPSGEPLGVRT
jgi:hypothetical protein